MVGLCAVPLNPLSAGYNTIKLASVCSVCVCMWYWEQSISCNRMYYTEIVASDRVFVCGRLITGSYHENVQVVL